MARGLAMWTMSKIVMLVFLFTVMGSLLYYQSWMEQNNKVSQARSVAMEIREGFNRILLPESLESRTFVPLPRKIAEKEYYFLVNVTRASGQKIVYVALATGSHDKGFSGPWDAASSFVVSNEVSFLNGTGDLLKDGPVQGSSLKYRFVMLNKSIDPGTGNMAVSVQACKRVSSGDCIA